MNQRRAIERLRELVEPDLKALAPNIIIPDGSGYLVFEIYALRPDRGLWQVSKANNLLGTMTSLKSAISWCVADKYRQHRLSSEIMRLDQQKLLLESDIRTRGALAKRSPNTSKSEAIRAKLDMRVRRLQDVDQRLSKCLNVAKYWQLRGFDNETSRSGRTASNRTYR